MAILILVTKQHNYCFEMINNDLLCDAIKI